jgi:hypothetical protein
VPSPPARIARGEALFHLRYLFGKDEAIKLIRAEIFSRRR